MQSQCGTQQLNRRSVSISAMHHAVAHCLCLQLNTLRCFHTRESCAISQQSHGRWDVTREPGMGPMPRAIVLQLQSYAAGGEVV